ncbi:thiamine/thiamine pyrophosphate ABC transporter permease ThiP [Pseudopelagicola sp. nBUS_20]|uniref:thiamine/thiamine pyrophosphate ABC transporter permease ThiP n=1 Tax=Pseudopelagicola sp. nBUS_20 TaxID=3395317 RepID=UPI003EB7A1FC
MADNSVTVKRWPGALAATIVASIVLGTLMVVVLKSEAGRGLGPAEWAAIWFTLWQALLSAMLSVVLAIPVARALARRRFLGRRLLIILLGAPFILPVIVAVFGLLAVFGHAGLVNTSLRWLGLPEVQIYGLHGVVLAHVFFNLPLATRLILQGWQDIPAERFRLAAQLSLRPRDIYRVLERPMLARVAPGAASVIFAICLSSFAVALTLGGGPKATTVELAIYQAFRFDFDLGRAALLSCVQIVLVGTAAVLALRLSGHDSFGTGMDRLVQRWDARGLGLQLVDVVWLSVATLFLVLPITLVFVEGIPGFAHLPSSVWCAAGVSLIVSLGSTVLMVCLAIPIAVTSSIGRGNLEAVGLLGMAASPLVIGTGLFIIIYRIADPFLLAFPVTAVVNAIMALPFALRVLVPAVRDVVQGYWQLSASLNISGLTWMWLVLLPRLRSSLGFACGLTAAMSMGDLGVVVLFADSQNATLPLQMFRLMGAYQMQAAASAAVLLMMMSFGLFFLMDSGGRERAQTRRP